MQENGRIALHMAAENGHTDIVNALLAAGVNVSARRTVLLAAGADVSARRTVRGLISPVCGGTQHSRCIVVSGL
jgi:ankyrin repeat protein